MHWHNGDPRVVNEYGYQGPESLAAIHRTQPTLCPKRMMTRRHAWIAVRDVLMLFVLLPMLITTALMVNLQSKWLRRTWWRSVGERHEERVNRCWRQHPWLDGALLVMGLVASIAIVILAIAVLALALVMPIIA